MNRREKQGALKHFAPFCVTGKSSADRQSEAELKKSKGTCVFLGVCLWKSCGKVL